MLELAELFLLDPDTKKAYNSGMIEKLEIFLDNKARHAQDTGMTDKKFKVFLDLEETVINNWDEGLLVNATKVREFLAEHNATEFTVFSFAVWNDEDKAAFERLHRRPLERALDCRVAACPSVEDFMRVDTEFTGLRFDSLTDFISIRGKVGAFTTWVRAHGLGNALLVDDVVPDVDIVTRTNGDTIRFVNVDSL